MTIRGPHFDNGESHWQAPVRPSAQKHRQKLRARSMSRLPFAASSSSLTLKWRPRLASARVLEPGSPATQRPKHLFRQLSLVIPTSHGTSKQIGRSGSPSAGTVKAAIHASPSGHGRRASRKASAMPSSAWFVRPHFQNLRCSVHGRHPLWPVYPRSRCRLVPELATRHGSGSRPGRCPGRRPARCSLRQLEHRI